MQATVRAWDAESRSGSVLLDDGRQVDFPGWAVQVRRLRPGQRVRLQVEGEQVVALTVSTLPFS